MKYAVAPATVLFAGVAVSSLLAQGLFQWGNNIQGVVTAPIYGLDPMNPFQPRSGNTATGFPAGTQTYAGAPLSGTGFTAAIYTGDDVAQVLANFNHIQLDIFRSGPGAGLISPHVTSDPNRPPGTANVHYQFRAWDNQNGTVTSWAQVMALGGILPCGASDVCVFSSPLSGPNQGIPDTAGIRSFQLTLVPEPSLIGLGSLGLGALLFPRRK